MKKARNTANLIILPYQYILNPFIRKSIRINLENSIIILDEGHNIIDVLEETSSSSINNKNCEDLEIIYQTIIDTPSEILELYDLDNEVYNSMINIFKFVNKKITETFIPKNSGRLKNTIELNIEQIKDFFYIPYDAEELNKNIKNIDSDKENNYDEDGINNYNVKDIIDKKELLINHIIIV